MTTKTPRCAYAARCRQSLIDFLLEHPELTAVLSQRHTCTIPDSARAQRCAERLGLVKPSPVMEETPDEHLQPAG